jgi:hypothetical protein
MPKCKGIFMFAATEMDFANMLKYLLLDALWAVGNPRSK